MSRFRFHPFQVEAETNAQGPRVVKVEQSESPRVESFQFPSLQESQTQQRATPPSRFKSLTSEVHPPQERIQKDSRFNLSHLVKSHLKVDEEERRAIEELVNERVAALAGEAKKIALKQGYEAGLKQGYQESFHKFQDEGRSRVERLESLVAEFENAKEDIFRVNERFLIDLIYQISKMLLLRELSTDREYILRLAEELIQRVGVRENVHIKISPNDVESIQMIKSGLEKNLGVLKNLQIETSSQIQQGGCLIETEWNALDASIETQLRGIYEALLGKSPVGQAS